LGARGSSGGGSDAVAEVSGFAGVRRGEHRLGGPSSQVQQVEGRGNPNLVRAARKTARRAAPVASGDFSFS
jgi:hypothetical protein